MSNYLYITIDGRQVGRYYKGSERRLAKAEAAKIGGVVNDLFYIDRSEPRLKYDRRLEEGVIKLPPTWQYCDYVWKMDCLGDWIAELEELRDNLRDEGRHAELIEHAAE